MEHFNIKRKFRVSKKKEKKREERKDKKKTREKKWKKYIHVSIIIKRGTKAYIAGAVQTSSLGVFSVNDLTFNSSYLSTRASSYLARVNSATVTVLFAQDCILK